MPTATPTELPTEVPTEVAVVNTEVVGTLIMVKVSHYEPWLGGTNCGYFANGECLSHMASGRRWQDWIDVAIACPIQLPFDTKIILDGRTWICMDRGGGIVFTGSAYWIDELTYHATHAYGTEVEARMVLP